VDARQHAIFGSSLALNDGFVRIAFTLQAAVSTPAISCYLTASCDVRFDKSREFISTAAFNDLHAQSAELATFAFDGNSDFALMFGPTATLAAVCTAEKSFIDLDGTGEFGSIRENRAGS